MSSCEKKYEFIWRIENFNSNLPKFGNEIIDNKCLASPNFKVYISGYTQWYLELYPKTGRSSSFIKCLPICMDYSKDCSVNSEIAILDQNGSVHASKKTKCRCSTVFHCDFSNAIELERAKLPQQNDLVFRCILTFDDECGENEATCNDTEGLSRDLLHLYQRQIHTDLTLCVGGNKLPVHRTIICIRAPKLAEELGIQDDENSSSVVSVDDIPLAVLKILLSYIYSGKIDVDVDAMLPELCSAAKKYQLDHLKSKLLPDVTHSTAHTKIKSTKKTFTWSIKDFSQFKKPIVKLIDMKISQFVITLSSSTSSTDDFQVGFKITSFPENKQVYLRCRISIVDVGGNFVLSSDHLFQFESDAITKKLNLASKEKWNFPTLLKKSDFITHKCLQDDTLKLHMELEITEGDKVSEILDVKKTLKDQTSNIEHLNFLSSDFFDIFKVRNRPGVGGDYYEGDCYNDIVLKVGDQEVGCHKAILCARSPVFARMLQRKSENEEVDISDIDHDTLLLMVQYIYSGQVTNLAATETMRLYIAAEKYQVSSLLKKCISLFEMSLTIHNVCDVLVLADIYSNEEMLTSLYEYMKRNKAEVLDSNEWKLLVGNNPVLTSKAILRMSESRARQREFYRGQGYSRRRLFRLVPRRAGRGRLGTS